VWAFHKLIPLVAPEHRVIAVDLPGFGDSGHEQGDYTSSFAAESLRQLVEYLELGPVHLTGQGIGAVRTFRLAAGHPELIRSYAAIETGLPGFGLEMLADVTHGGTWHIGVLAAPGIPEMLGAQHGSAVVSGSLNSAPLNPPPLNSATSQAPPARRG
jgi:pimeloyl-ACP methyl ester carboxylesterase